MSKIKCSCGETKCTTVLTIESNTNDATIAIEHSNSTSNNRLDISLDANNIVSLIKQLKTALNDITNNA